MKYITLILISFSCSFTTIAQEKLSDTSVKEFADKAIEKAKDLGTYIEIVSDKNTNNTDAMDAIDLAVKLFIDDEQSIAISSLNREDVRTFPVRTYLQRLNLLKYSKVEVQWYDVHYVSNLRKGTDGRYYGIVTVYQKFTGYSGDNIKYADVTEKNIEIVLDRIPKNVGGTTVNVWEVYLGNITVAETTTLNE